MTEEEWLAATDPIPMLRVLGHKASDRKLRLFSVACCRRIWESIEQEKHRYYAVPLAERHADGLATDEELWEVFLQVAEGNPYAGFETSTGCMLQDFAVHDSVECAVATADAASTEPGYKKSDFEFEILASAEKMTQSGFVRDIFGNPFRSGSFSPDWRTSIAVSLAQSIYDDRQLPSGLFNNQRLGVLADALEDAGCDNADLLGHLRNGGEHVRGCWVLDLILGKR